MRPGGPSREELVRQLLSRLSHPAREKDHLARRADISNDTAARFFGTLVRLLLRLPPYLASGSPSRDPLALDESVQENTRGRCPPPPVSSPECVSVIAHVSPLLILLVERCFLAEGSCDDRRLFKVTASIRRRKEQRTAPDANIDPLSVIHRAGR